MYIIIAGILWGFMGLFVRVFTESFGFSSEQVTTIRLFTAGIMFLLLLLIKDKRLLKIKLRDIWVFLALGVCSIYFMTLFYFKSMTSDTSVSVSAILLYTAPIIVMIASCLLFGEKFTKKKLLALCLAFVGCILVCMGNDVKVTFMGFIYGLLSGFAYASYSIFGKIALKKGYSSYTISAYSFIIAGTVSVILGNPYKIVTHTFSLMPSLHLSLLIIMIGLVSAFLPFLFYTKGLEKTPAGKASIMASVEPLVATVCGLFLGEDITISIILGMAGILSSIVLLNVKAKE